MTTPHFDPASCPCIGHTHETLEEMRDCIIATITEGASYESVRRAPQGGAASGVFGKILTAAGRFPV